MANESRLDDLYSYIESYTTNNGYGPSYRDMAGQLGYASMATVRSDLEDLKSMNMVTWEDGKARTVRTTNVIGQIRGH